MGVRKYIPAKDIDWIDSECGHSEDCWVVYDNRKRAGYISRADAAKLIFG